MINWFLGLFGYKIIYVSEFGQYDTRYNSIDWTMARPIHENMSTAPPWAKMKVVPK